MTPDRSTQNIAVHAISKQYGGRVVLSDVTLNIGQGERVSLMGPNGSGKSTLIRILAGLERADNGSVTFGGDTRWPRLGYVFQEGRASLLPWRSVRDNIVFPLRLRGWDRQRIDAILGQTLDRLNLSVNLSSPVYHLSGGEAQKIVIARAMITEPELLLCDEPFTALDLEAHLDVRQFLARGLDALPIRPTVAYVHHNLDDALLLSDRVFVLPRSRNTVPQELEVKVPWPRDDSLIDSDAFVDLRTTLSHYFRQACAATLT